MHWPILIEWSQEKGLEDKYYVRLSSGMRPDVISGATTACIDLTKYVGGWESGPATRPFVGADGRVDAGRVVC